MGIEDLDHMTGQMNANMSPQLMEKIKKKKKNKNRHKSTTTPATKTISSSNNVAVEQQQEKLQKLIEQMEQHLQQQQQQQPVTNYQQSLPQYGSNDLPIYGSSDLPQYVNNDLPIYGSSDLPQYGPSSRPPTVTFPSNFNQVNPSEKPVSASFPYTPIQATTRPTQSQYVSSTTTFSDGLPEYSPGLSQYGSSSSSFQNDLPQYNRPSSRPSFISTSSPIEQSQYNVVSTPSQVQYSQNIPSYGQTDDLPQYFGNQQPSNFRGSPSGESWFPVNQNQNQFQSTYTGSTTASPSVFANSKPVRFPSGSSIQQYSSISRQDPYEVIHYDDEDDDWYDPLTHSYHSPSMVSSDKSSGPLVPPPTYGKNHLQSLESTKPAINIIAELAKYSSKRNIFDQGKVGSDPYIISDQAYSSDGSEIIMYPSGNLIFLKITSTFCVSLK